MSASDAISTGDARETMRQSEARLTSSFHEDVADDLSIADDSAALLLAVILRTAPEAVSIELHLDEDGTPQGDVATLQLAAQLFIGIRAFRAMRASQFVLASGYELEARALDRIIVELLAHRQAIVEDASGAEALAWLNGERGWGISKRVTEITPKDLYKNLSHDSHGDPVGVARLIDPDTQNIIVSPNRTLATRATLLMHAGFARDQAVVIAQLAGLHPEGIDGLTTAIKSRWALLDEQADGATVE